MWKAVALIVHGHETRTRRCNAESATSLARAFGASRRKASDKYHSTRLKQRKMLSSREHEPQCAFH